MHNENYMIPLFSYPLMKSKIDFIEQKEIDFVNNLEKKRYGASNGYRSNGSNLLEHNQMSSLKSQIDEKFYQYAYDILKIDPEIKFSIVGSFVNYHYPGDYAQTHKHDNSLFSCVLYLKVPPNSGGIVFDQSFSHSPISREIILNYTERNVFNSAMYIVIPEELDLLIFPSTCYHSVQKNTSDLLRSSLVVSYFPCSTLFGDNGETVLNLTSVKN